MELNRSTRYTCNVDKNTCIHADSEFEPLGSEISDLGIYINYAPKKEHVPEIELFNRNVKK